MEEYYEMHLQNYTVAYSQKKRQNPCSHSNSNVCSRDPTLYYLENKIVTIIVNILYRWTRLLYWYSQFLSHLETAILKKTKSMQQGVRKTESSV